MRERLSHSLLSHSIHPQCNRSSAEPNYEARRVSSGVVQEGGECICFKLFIFLGLELIRMLPVYDLKRNKQYLRVGRSDETVMVDSDVLISCSSFLLDGCKITYVFFF